MDCANQQLYILQSWRSWLANKGTRAPNKAKKNFKKICSILTSYKTCGFIKHDK